MKIKSFRIESVVVALGFVLLGVFVYLGLDSLATRDRIVSVRGLAEREVKANKVIWPVVYKTTGNDLNAIYADINNANKVIAAFLKGNGIEEKEISAGAPRIIDLQAERYADRKHYKEAEDYRRRARNYYDRAADYERRARNAGDKAIDYMRRAKNQIDNAARRR